jgi:hypothetical protein
VLALACLAGVVLVWTSGADNVAARACGGVEKSFPTKNVSRGRAPLAIGDSPMLLPLPNLADAGYRANARGCRQFPEGLDVLREYKRKGHLAPLVTIALGSNGIITKTHIHKALRIIGKRRTLGLVTPRELGGGSGADAAIVRKEADEHPKRIVLLDWVKYSEGHSGWFQSDGLHLTSEGAVAFTKLLRKPIKDLPPPHHQR